MRLESILGLWHNQKKHFLIEDLQFFRSVIRASLKIIYSQNQIQYLVTHFVRPKIPRCNGLTKFLNCFMPYKSFLILSS